MIARHKSISPQLYVQAAQLKPPRNYWPKRDKNALATVVKGFELSIYEVVVDHMHAFPFDCAFRFSS